MKQCYVFRKVGQQPDPNVLRMLKLRHPNVRLLWEPHRERWLLAELVKGKLVLLRVLEDHGRYVAPSMANTVYTLDELHPGNLYNRYMVDKFLKRLDEPKDQALIQKDKAAKERIEEGSKRLWWAMKRPTILLRRQPPGGGCSATCRRCPRSPSRSTAPATAATGCR